MKLVGGASFWNFGAFPVLAAATFQIAIIVQAADSLAEFFVVQSFIAIGLSLACLQPRTWNSELRVPSRLRWSLVLSLAVLAAAGFYYFLFPSPLGMVIGALIAKKTCDVGREFVFLGALTIPASVTVLVTVMELVGIVLLFTGLLPLAIVLYSAAGMFLIVCALFSVRGESWAVRWVIGEIPHALSMTLFNMGSRLFLVAVPSSMAHLSIGSMLQVVSFASPVTYAVYSRTRRFHLYLIGWLLYSIAIIVGSQVFIWLGGGSGASLFHIVVFGALIAFNSSSVVRISASADRRVRNLLGVCLSCWAGLGALLGVSGLFEWEIAFILFLAINAVIIVCFGSRRQGQV